MNSAQRENINVALKSIRSQLLRTILTIMIIALGITALVCILTAIDALKNKITNDFARMGANTFSIRAKSGGGQRSGGVSEKNYKVLDYYQAREFEQQYEYPSTTSISAVASGIATLKYKSEKTNPNVRVAGGSLEYLNTSGEILESGRNFSNQEMINGNNVVIIGQDVIKKLFINDENPLGKIISIGSMRYEVIGALESKGNSIGFSGDNNVIIPISNLKLNYATPYTRYVINVATKNPDELDNAIEEASGLMRIIRRDRPGDEESFEIRQSDGVANMVIEELSFISIAAVIIALITLFGAAIGLMNIMLVSVTERTREIGIRKSLGASSDTIRWQFLVEAIAIGQIGGIIGIILGIILGNVVAAIVETDFIIPWAWMILAVVMCLITSVLSGVYPSNKAAQLDPIEALRYE